MGWIPEDGYQKFVKKPENSNKVTEEQEMFNQADLNDIRTGIEIAQQQYAKDYNIDIPKTKPKSKEPIEYVVEEEKEELEL